MSEITKAGNSITKQNVDEKMIKDYLFTTETKLTDKQQLMFLQIALRHNLDPFKREVYAIAYGKEFSIVTGYQVYIERASASGNLNGWSCVNTDEGAKITIYRKDWEHPFEWEATYDEFDKGQSSWSKMRKFMIKKVCMGQGFRLAFPEELAGMPYLKEEMEGAVPFNAKPPVQKTQSKSGQKAKPPAKPTGEAGEHCIRIKNVNIQEGTSTKSGKPYTKYTIESVEGSAYSTFSDTWGQEAMEIVGTLIEVRVKFESGKYGNTIKEFDITGEVPNTDELPPVDYEPLDDDMGDKA